MGSIPRKTGVKAIYILYTMSRCKWGLNSLFFPKNIPFFLIRKTSDKWDLFVWKQKNRCSIYGIFKNGGLEDDFPFELGDLYVPSKFSVVYLKSFRSRVIPRTPNRTPENGKLPIQNSRIFFRDSGLGVVFRNSNGRPWGSHVLGGPWKFQLICWHDLIEAQLLRPIWQKNISAENFLSTLTWLDKGKQETAGAHLNAKRQFGKCRYELLIFDHFNYLWSCLKSCFWVYWRNNKWKKWFTP